MAGNDAFTLRQGSGWSRGLDNFVRAGLTEWFGTRTWWTQLLIWVGVIDGILAMVLYSSQQAQAQEAGGSAVNEGAMLYSLFTGMFVAIGIVIIMQEAIVGERKNGTAAWVLSKPLRREAFIISKLLSNLVGILVTMVLVPGLIAYVLISMLGAGEWLPFGSFLAALACLAVALFFYQTLVTMFGTLFENRGAVIGLSLAFIFGQQFMTNLLPSLLKVLPVAIFLPPGDEGTMSIAGALILGQPVPDMTPVFASLILSFVFIAIALWKFRRLEM
jgi:ABC-2 type transport system permease protein